MAAPISATRCGNGPVGDGALGRERPRVASCRGRLHHQGVDPGLGGCRASLGGGHRLREQAAGPMERGDGRRVGQPEGERYDPGCEPRPAPRSSRASGRRPRPDPRAGPRRGAPPADGGRRGRRRTPGVDRHRVWCEEVHAVPVGLGRHPRRPGGQRVGLLVAAARNPRLPAPAAARTRAGVVGPPAIGAARTGRVTPRRSRKGSRSTAHRALPPLRRRAARHNPDPDLPPPFPLVTRSYQRACGVTTARAELVIFTWNRHRDGANHSASWPVDPHRARQLLGPARRVWTCSPTGGSE